MLDTIFATKKEISQTFLADATRIPVTRIQAGPCVVTQIKNLETDGYQAVQLGFAEKKKKQLTKPIAGHLKKVISDKQTFPRYLREVRGNFQDVKVGDKFTADQIFKPGDLVNITGKSKGKGFTGVMKRWGFRGGPRTHGQSDRKRAPGSIGQTTTPGRVYKGKKMAGRSGGSTVTIRNLLIVKVKNNGEIWVKGHVPGTRNAFLKVKKVTASSNFKGIKEDKMEDTEEIKASQKSLDVKKGSDSITDIRKKDNHHRDNENNKE